MHTTSVAVSAFPTLAYFRGADWLAIADHRLSGSHDAYRLDSGTYYIYEELNLAPHRCKRGHGPL